jgi:hypothetical protein
VVYVYLSICACFICCSKSLLLCLSDSATTVDTSCVQMIKQVWRGEVQVKFVTHPFYSPSQTSQLLNCMCISQHLCCIMPVLPQVQPVMWQSLYIFIPKHLRFFALCLPLFLLTICPLCHTFPSVIWAMPTTTDTPSPPPCNYFVFILSSLPFLYQFQQIQVCDQHKLKFHADTTWQET